MKGSSSEKGGEPVLPVIPSDFVCPLSHRVMEEPVIIASGQTFDRCSIEAWLSQGNRTCPKTKQPLEHLCLIPNHAVKALIAAWCRSQHQHQCQRASSNSLADDSVSSLAGLDIEEEALRVLVCPRRRCTASSSSSSTCSSVVTSAFVNSSQAFAGGEGTSQIHPTDSISDFSSDLSGELQRLAGLSSSFCLPSSNPKSFQTESWNGRDNNNQWQGEAPETAFSSSFSKYKDGGFIVKRLVAGLGSKRVEEQRKAAAEIRSLTKSDIHNRNSFANAGAIPLLINLLKTEDSLTQEHAVTCLLNLAINEENKSIITAAGVIPGLIEVLQAGSSSSRENAAFALFILSSVEENKVGIVAAGAIVPLIDLLVNGSLRGKKDAATALYSLSSRVENKVRIVRAGAVKPLVDFMADSSSGMVEKAVAILNNLVMVPEGRVALAEEGGIPVLVELIELGSKKGKEISASVLLQLCTNSTKHRTLVLQEGAIPPLVALSQTGNARAKETASTLLRHLRDQRNTSTGLRPAQDIQNNGHG